MDGRIKGFTGVKSISVISGQWKGEYERLCAMWRRLGSGRISSGIRSRDLVIRSRER